MRYNSTDQNLKVWSAASGFPTFWELCRLACAMEQANDENFGTSSSQMTEEVETGQGEEDEVEVGILASQRVEQIAAEKRKWSR